MGTQCAVVIVTYNRLNLLEECIRCVEMQTVSATKIIIVNNASTDNTAIFLEKKKQQNDSICIIDCEHNVGGAGGFCRGIQRASEEKVDLVLLIDDDAMLADDYMERIIEGRNANPQYKAFAGAVMVDGEIDLQHRRNVCRYGLRTENCTLICYQSDCFECDVATFCGMAVDMHLIEKIGFPLSEYFIWHDDTEYSLRINKYSKFLVLPQAILIHKTANSRELHLRRYDWREYYGIRNRLLYVKKHGTFWDWLLTRIDIWWNVEFRNWLFGLIHRDGYDWKYEKKIVRAALKNAREDQVRNVFVER